MALSPNLRKLKLALEGAGVVVGADAEHILLAAVAYIERAAEAHVTMAPEETPARPVPKPRPRKKSV